MENPVIIQFDGDENYHTVVDLICFNMGLEISRHILSVKSAKKLFSEIEEKKLKPTIAIVSSYLERDHRDGIAVSKKLKELVPNIKIVGYTVIQDEDWYDELAVKSNINPEKSIIETLERLTDHKFKSSNVID